MKNNKWSIVGAMLCVAVINISSQAQIAPPTAGYDVTGAIADMNPKVHKAWVPPFQSHIVTTDACPVLVYIQPVLGPKTDNPGYQMWASNTLRAVYNLGKYPGKLPNQLGYRLLPEYITQQTAEMTNWTTWDIIQIVAKDRNFKFTPTGRIRYVGKSTDAGNSLGKTNDFTNPNLIHSPYGSLAINWGAIAPRDADDVDTSAYWNALPVNEFIFIGAMRVYYNATVGVVSNYIGAFPDFQETGTWQFLDSNGVNVMSYARRTLYTKSDPIRWPLTIRNSDPGYVRIGVNLSSTDSGTLYWRELANQGVWVPTCTVNGNDSIDRPTAPFSSGFWSLVLQ